MSAAAARQVGYMPMPAGFEYRALFLHGRPRHQKYDTFWIKHPPMNVTHRAKIFSAFDALAGFDDCIAEAALKSITAGETTVLVKDVSDTRFAE